MRFNDRNLTAQQLCRYEEKSIELARAIMKRHIAETMVQDGKSAAQIASTLNVSYGTALRVGKLHGYVGRRRGSSNLYSQDKREREEAIVTMLKSGAKYSDIGKCFSISKQAVALYAKKHGLTRKK